MKRFKAGSNTAPTPERVKLQRANDYVNPRSTCVRCLHLNRLRVYRDEDKFYVGVGCDCTPKVRLSDIYTEHTEALLDMVSLSWRE